MKAALLLLLTAFSAIAHAQAPGAGGADQGPPHAPGAPATPLALANLEGASPGGRETGQPGARRLDARREAAVIARRLQARQKALDDRNEAQYAENRRRCAVAMRIADQCGKFVGRFYCGEKGFVPIRQDVESGPVAMDRGSRNKMERCAALEAAKHGP